MADLIGQTIDHYLIERYIGQGGMGSVFQARDISLGRQVAIKFIHAHLASQEKFQQQFLQQIRDAAAFDHPNIVRIFAHDYRDDHLYLVMQYIAEGSLRDYLDQLQGEQMRLDDAIQVASQAADALAYAHERGIIHRNLKPENILFKKRPTADPSTEVDAALADVGLAQVAARLTGTTVGLPSAMFLYMAPEQALSQQLDARVDIYALGVIMYEMVAGRPPYQPRSITEAMQMKTQPIPPPSTIRPGIPPELDRIILECMAADPNGRYQSADELLQDLRPLQTDRLRREAIEVQALPVLEDEREDTEPVQEIPTPEAPPAPVIPTPLPTPAPVVNGGDQYFQTEPEIEVPREGAEHDQLIIVEDRRPTRTVTLDRDLMILGRDEDCDIVLDHHRVSRRHARLERTPMGSYFITDLGTTNGTWLNNVRLAPEMETPWRPGDIVRVGDLWLTIETDDELAHITEPLISEAPLSKPAPRRAPGGKVDALLIPTAITVEPGGAANIALEIINDSDAAAHFMVEVQDIPSTWVTLPGHSVHVEAHDSTTISLILHPLRASDSSVGLHAFTVVVKSLAQDVSAAVQGQIQITPFYEFSADLQPKQVRSGQETYVVISNLGNTPAYYRIAADVYQGDLEFDLPGEAVNIGPGQRAHVPVRIRVRNRPLIMGDSITPFTLIVSDELGVEWQQAGSVVASPLISVLFVSLLGLMALLGCGVLALLGYVQYSAILAANETATSVVAIAVSATNLQGTRVAAQATFEASDPDNDDLTNAEELEVGTDAQIFDTDEDGLSDGREVNQSHTDPLDPDTDNDGLLDGVDPNPLVALDPSKPDDFVILYYMQINDRDYDDAWAALTDNFRYNTGLYNQQIFEDFWNDINEVEIGQVYTVTEEADFACVFAELTYDLADGRIVPDDAPFIYLLHDGQGSWLINAKFDGHDNGLG